MRTDASAADVPVEEKTPPIHGSLSYCLFRLFPLCILSPMQFSWSTLQRIIAIVLAVSAIGGTAYWWTGEPRLADAREGVIDGRLKEIGLDTHQREQAIRGVSFSALATHLRQVVFSVYSSLFGKADSPASPEPWFLRLLGFNALLAAMLALIVVTSAGKRAAGRSLAAGLACLAFVLMWFLVCTQDQHRALWFVRHFNVRLAIGAIQAACLGGCLVMPIRFFQSFPREIGPTELVESLPSGMQKFIVGAISWGRSKILDWATIVRWLPVLFALVYLGPSLFLLSDMKIAPWTIAQNHKDALDLVALIVFIFMFLGVTMGGAAILVMVPFYSWLYLRAGRLNCAPDERRKTDWIYAAFLAVFAFCAVAVLLHWMAFTSLMFGEEGVRGMLLTDLVLLVLLFLSFKLDIYPLVRKTVGGIAGLGLAMSYLTIVTAKGAPPEFYLATVWTAGIGIPAMLLILLTGLGFSVFFRGAFEPSLLVRKTVLVGLVALLMGGTIIVLEHFAVGSILGAFGSEAVHGTSTVMAGAFVTMGLHPLRHRLQHKISHLTDHLMPATVIAEGKRLEQVVAFSDLSSFTALSATDEQKALHVAGLFHKAARRIAGSHHGRIVKTIGDAVLWVFPDVPAALNAVAVLHQEFIQDCAKEKLPALGVHSGVHAGPVVVDRAGDVYGATVNLASRLQSLAANNEIVVSEAVRSTAGDTALRFEALGGQQLKNVPAPVACFRVTTGA